MRAYHALATTPRQGKANTLTRSAAARTMLVATAALLIACAAGPEHDGTTPTGVSTATPPTLPTRAIHGMTAVDDALDLDTFADRAADPGALRTVLIDAGFSGASERSFRGGRGTFASVVSTGLAFGDPSGAGSYLEWLRANANQFLGDVTRVEKVAPGELPPDAVFLVHHPDACCHLETPIYFAAWQRGDLVLSLQATGRKAKAEPLVPLIAAYDREV
jgi:hypothetical protein